MPTFAKLIAGLFFAALGWLCGDLIKPLLPEGTAVGMLSPVIAIWGFLMGWLFCGHRIQFTQASPWGIGLTTSLLIFFWSLLSFSGYEMLRYALRRRYDGPFEALQSMMEIAVDQLKLVSTPEIIGALVVGGIAGGWLTRWTADRWR